MEAQSESPVEQRTVTLFLAAMSRDPGEREAFLDEACRDDAELRGEVQRRVAWEDKLKGFLLRPATQRERLDRSTRSSRTGSPSSARGLSSAKRLSPEALRSLRVTHVNVCRVFEIHTAETPSGDVDFLTMAFVDGETLSRKLEAAPVRWLDTEEGAALARQMCDGLAAVHAEGVIHRDLKPSNDPEPRMSMAYDLYMLNSPVEAEMALNEAIALNPRYYLPYFDAGFLAQQRRMFALAERHWREGIRLAPATHVPMGLDFAELLIQMGRLAEAEAYIKELRRTHPPVAGRALTHTLEAALAEHAGNLGGALTLYEQAMKTQRKPAFVNPHGGVDQHLPPRFTREGRLREYALCGSTHGQDAGFPGCDAGV